MTLSKIGVTLGGAVIAGIGLLGFAAPASAAPASTWVTYGYYPTQSECADVGKYLVQQHWYISYGCARSGSQWKLSVLDY
ncbi:hypothetical protein [Actinoplanes sp. NPDC026670]|uniref:hypothetical protein n=1 Tax=Actinoplanes sp. NPDC026670 TaxID=3154700 RepID=UPI00340E4AA6